MRLGWLSDIHLNFLADASAEAFVRDLAGLQADAWLVTGDIGEAGSVARYLQMFAARLPSPTYVALGNHDFYGGSLAAVRREVARLAGRSDRLVWLGGAGPQAVGGGVVIVGDDGWADARFGDALTTPVLLNDFLRIAELKGLARPDLVRTLNRLGDEAAARLAGKLDEASRLARRVVVLTHVPPFREAAWHEGRPCDDDWAPWFACRAMGEAILDCGRRHPRVGYLVLCGHTHGAGLHAPLPNVAVHTAGAAYGDPRVQRIFTVDPQDADGRWWA